jgi:hypothetical protein
MKQIKIRLDEDDFQCLVSGGILTLKDAKNKQEIAICLADIGFHRMDHCITQVDTGKVEPYSHLNKDLK